MLLSMWFGQFWSRSYIERDRIESKNWMNQSKNVERTLIEVLLIGKSSGFALEFGKCWKSSKRKTFWTSFVILPLVISIIHISMLFFEMICILNDYNEFHFFCQFVHSRFVIPAFMDSYIIDTRINFLGIFRSSSNINNDHSVKESSKTTIHFWFY